MFDFRLLLVCLDSLELQELVADIAEVCASHVANKYYERDGYDLPLFVKTFESTYNDAFASFSKDEEFPF